MKYQKNVEAALVNLMRAHSGTLTIDPATQPAQAVTLERMADAGIVVLVSRGAAGMSTYRLYEQQRFQPGQPVTWEPGGKRSEEHTSELQSRQYLVCRLLLE